MKIKDIIEAKGYETDTVRICKFLGFDDTNQLKGAKFFSQEQSYSPILIYWQIRLFQKTRYGRIYVETAYIEMCE